MSSLITPDKSTRVTTKGRTKGWGRILKDRRRTKTKRKSISSGDRETEVGFGVSGTQGAGREPGCLMPQGTRRVQRPQVGRVILGPYEAESPVALSTGPPVLHHCPDTGPENCWLETPAKGATRVSQHSPSCVMLTTGVFGKRLYVKTTHQF